MNLKRVGGVQQWKQTNRLPPDTEEVTRFDVYQVFTYNLLLHRRYIF